MDLSEIIFEFKKQYELDKTLFINISEFSIFKGLSEQANMILEMKESKDNKIVISGDPFHTLNNVNDKFDLIVGDLPFGWKPEELFKDEDKNINIKGNKNWIVLFKSLFKLSKKGYAIFTIEPSLLGTLSGDKFIDNLNEQGFYINTIFNTPEKILMPQTQLRPIMIIISKHKTHDLFVAELDDLINYKKVLSNLKIENSDNIQNGLIIKKSNFKGFEKYKISNELDRLAKQYKAFSKYNLGDIASEINIGKELEEKENSIYIPKIGTSKVICNLKDSKIKHQNLIQIVLNKKIVHAKYLTLFFNTNIGKLNLRLLTNNTFIPHINKRDIENMVVSIPDIPLQKKIYTSVQKLNQLKDKIDIFEEEIALNPLSVNKVENELDSLLNSLNLLNESDKILSLIREGEHKKLEFKATLRKSIDKGKEHIPDSVIEKSTLKNLAGFMNSEGGILLVGINDDDGEILGLKNDQFKSEDDLLKHVKNLIKRDFGSEVYDLIDYKIINIENKQILRFNCKPSKNEIFLGKEQEFFVRTNPATDKLTGKEMVNYIKSHFGDNK